MSNQVGRQIKIKVGPTDEDWSQSLVSYEPTYSSLSESGVINWSAKLILKATETSPGSLNPATNTIWRLGQTITFWDPTDTLQIGYFKIVKPPIYSRVGTLTISLGCWLTWATTLELDENRSGIDLGANLNSGEVITNLLESVGIPLANLNIPTNLPYTLGYPLIKEGKSSFVDLAGKLAYSNDCHYLYQDNLGVIQVGQWDASNTTPYDTITLGQHESYYEAQPDAIEPVEKLIVAGIGYQVVGVDGPFSVSAEITEPAKNYNPSSFGSVVLRTTLTTETDLENRTIERSVVNRQPRSATWVSETSILSTSITQVNTEEYDLTNGQLLEIRDFEFGNVRVLVGPDDPAIGEVVIKRTIKEYEYNTDLIVIKETIRETVPKMTIDGKGQPSESGRFGQETVRLTITEWYEERPNFWVRRVRKYAVAGQNPDKRGGQIDPLALLSLKPEVYPDSPPPATKYWKDGVDLQATEYSAEVNWEQPSGATGLTRSRTILIEPAFSNAQCFEVATRTLEIYEGRAGGHIIQWELEPTESWYWVPPLTNLGVAVGGSTELFKVDSLSWYFTANRAYIGAFGVHIGASGITPGQTPPDEPPLFEPPAGECIITNPSNTFVLLGPSSEPIACYSNPE
jgi:hypothetical protein